MKVKELLIITAGLTLRPVIALKAFIFKDLPCVFKNYMSHDGELSTCAIAFFLLISFIPASLVFISILSFFYDSNVMAAFYINQIKSQLPSININDITAVIDKVVYKKRHLALIWIPFLFWWSSLVFDILETALGRAFRIKNARIYWKSKIRHFIIILSMGFFILFLTVFSNFLTILKNSDIAYFIKQDLSDINFINNFLILARQTPFILISITTLFINTLLIFIIYKFVPPQQLNNKSLFKGALFASLSYEIIKSIFSYYITEINDYTSIFGSLNTIVILMIWIWYTCFLMVIGAEMAWIIYEKKMAGSSICNDNA